MDHCTVTCCYRYLYLQDDNQDIAETNWLLFKNARLGKTKFYVGKDVAAWT